MSTKPDGGEWTWDEIVTYCRRSNHYGDETPRGAPGWSQLANLIVAAERARHPHPAAPVASGGVEVRGVELACVTAEICDIDGDGETFALGFEGCDTAIWVKPKEGEHAPRKVGQRVIVSVRLTDPTGGVMAREGLTRQGVRDLSTMGPKRPERNKKATDYAHGPTEWEIDPLTLWLMSTASHKPRQSGANPGEE